MLVYVLFVVLQTGSSSRGGLASFQYEFKDRIQCEKAGEAMSRRFSYLYSGYCQEVRK